MADFPVYKCVIDDNLESDLQVDFVALVDKPAIEKNFLAFKEKLRFNIDEDKKIVSGPAMLADMLIYRNDDVMGEYYATFDKEAISKIILKFFKKGFIQNFNLMHDPELKTSGVTIFESFQTDSNRGVAPMKGFEDAAEGSWFISAKVDNEEVWAKVKSGEVKGFSVEGMFARVPIKMRKISQESALAKIKAILDNTADE